MKHPRVFVAGTFDGVHKGHVSLLSKAFSMGGMVTIGLTSDSFVKKFKIPASPVGRQNAKFKIRKHEDRKRSLEQWLREKKLIERSAIVSIDDPWEPAASYAETFVLIVSTETKKRGEELNALRLKRGLKPAHLVVVPLIKADDGLPISSTRLREGSIDEQGRLHLPDALRSELQQPIGPVLSGRSIGESIDRHRNGTIVTVGDVATKTLLDAGVTPALIIIDNLVERKPYKGLAKWKRTALGGSKSVKSGPGYIAKNAIKLIQEWARNPQETKVIEVIGEEDLLALPVISEAPIGAVVYYGQPGIVDVRGKSQVEGLVEVEVTAEKQKQAVAQLKQFT